MFLRWLRLTVYHRLTVLRLRQPRFDELAEICHAVLAQPLGPARESRPHLLLMLTESRLECGDLVGAYFALLELHRTPLNLVESLRPLAIQTRYEVTSGLYAVAIQRSRTKVQLAELMPVPQCGAMNAMFATAAQRMGHARLARWLWDRAVLLCSDEQLRQLVGPAMV